MKIRFFYKLEINLNKRFNLSTKNIFKKNVSFPTLIFMHFINA